MESFSLAPGGMPPEEPGPMRDGQAWCKDLVLAYHNSSLAGVLENTLAPGTFGRRSGEDRQ